MIELDQAVPHSNRVGGGANAREIDEGSAHEHFFARPCQQLDTPLGIHHVVSGHSEVPSADISSNEFFGAANNCVEDASGPLGSIVVVSEAHALTAQLVDGIGVNVVFSRMRASSDRSAKVNK